MNSEWGLSMSAGKQLYSLALHLLVTMEAQSGEINRRTLKNSFKNFKIQLLKRFLRLSDLHQLH
jgi:hypothetical protein